MIQDVEEASVQRLAEESEKVLVAEDNDWRCEWRDEGLGAWQRDEALGRWGDEKQISDLQTNDEEEAQSPPPNVSETGSRDHSAPTVRSFSIRRSRFSLSRAVERNPTPKRLASPVKPRALRLFKRNGLREEADWRGADRTNLLVAAQRASLRELPPRPGERVSETSSKAPTARLD